jgi:hypothetical protein
MRLFFILKNNECIVIFFLGQNHYHIKGEEILYIDIALCFQFSFVWKHFMTHKHEALWPLRNCKFNILCTLILFNPLHLIDESKLILTQNEL